MNAREHIEIAAPRRRLWTAGPLRLDLLAIAVFAVAAAAMIGAQSAPDAWYDTLRKPSFNPPNAIFGPVWTALYAMMAAAAWLVAREPQADETRRRIALVLFATQLALNALWSPLFFGMHEPGFAFLDICVLWLALGATVLACSAVKPLAAALLVPYLAWVSFALILNGSIWLMNR